MRLEEARVVTLDPEHELKPAKRQAGVSITHYLSGWYTLRNGEDALVFVYKTDRVLYLPTYRGHSVLLGVGDPELILEQLRSGAPASP